MDVAHPLIGSTMAGSTSVTGLPVPTLFDLLKERLQRLGAGTASVADSMPLDVLLTHLSDEGLEPNRILVPLQTEVKMISASFGGRLRTLRQRNNLSQEGLAKKIGVPTGTVTQWETGRRSPTFKMVVKVCKALKIDLNVFAGCDLPDDEDTSSDKSDIS